MNKEIKNTKKIAVGLFLLCICIAFVCFGIFTYIAFLHNANGYTNERIIAVSKIVVLIGIFFLILAFGHLLPAIFSHKNASNEQADTSEIFSELRMVQILGKYIPEGETLLAGIHAISKEINIKTVFSKCFCLENKLVPHENGNIITINKKKYSTYDIYIGITQSSLLIAECEPNNYLYQFDDKKYDDETNIPEAASDILFADIGTRFSLTDIQKCEFKNGWMGSVNCTISMKNGSYFKLMLPKLGGLGAGMPHHAKYREIIIKHLSECNTQV